MPSAILLVLWFVPIFETLEPDFVSTSDLVQKFKELPCLYVWMLYLLYLFCLMANYIGFILVSTQRVILSLKKDFQLNSGQTLFISPGVIAV